MNVLLAMTHPALVASRYDWGAAWPESSVWLLGLLPAGCDRAGMELAEHFRGTVRERVVGYFAERGVSLRDRCRLLREFGERHGAADAWSETAVERLRLAEEGWAAGDYRSSQLLYAVVCSHLEQGLSQPSVLESVVRRLEELNHLTDAWQVGDAASGEAAATAEQLESALLGLSELEAECGELLAQVRTQTSETAVLSAEPGEDYEVLCRLSGELTGLKSERDRLREKRLLVERLWVERQR